MFLEHVNLTVRDLERSVAFYCEVLGLRVRWRGTNADGQPNAHVGDDRCYLSLFEAPRSAALPGPGTEPDYDHVGFNHFGWVVESLNEASRRLRAQGIRPRFETSYDPGQRLYFLDPDGIEVELVEYASPGESTAVRGEAS